MGFDNINQQQIEPNRKLRRIYSTIVIDKLLKERAEGYDIPYDAFFNRDLELRAANISFKMTSEEMEIYQKCVDNPIFYVENYCKFLTDAGRSLIKLRDYQADVINKVTAEQYLDDLDLFGPKNRNIIWMASRQCAKTTTIAAFISWMLIFNIDKNILVVANKEKTAIEIVDKITNIFKGLPFFLKPGCINFGKTGLKLENGSQIFSSATTNSASIGFTIHLVLLDEFAHIPDNIVNNFWRSVYPTLSSSKISQCIITSTPNGTTNKFYDIWTGANENKNSFIPIRTDYWQVPGHDDKWAEFTKKDFGEEEFAQEFELQFNINSKMLLKGEDLKFINRIKKTFIPKALLTNNEFLKADKNIVWDPNFDPNNINTYDKFIFIIDLAEGKGSEENDKNKKKTPDSNTIQIFKLEFNSIANVKRQMKKTTNLKIEDIYRFIQVGVYSCNTEDETYCANICSGLAYDVFHSQDTDNVRIMIEMNFNGKSFLTTFKLHRNYEDATVQKTYHTKPVPGEKQRRHPGFKTTTTKEFYCTKGAKMIHTKKIIIKHKETYTQLQSFGYVRGKLGGIACHDDLSMPALNHIPRILDDETFIAWIEDGFLENTDQNKQILKYKLNILLELSDMNNPEISDDEFNDMYNFSENKNNLYNSNIVENIIGINSTYGELMGKR